MTTLPNDGSSETSARMQLVRARGESHMDDFRSGSHRMMDWREHVRAHPVASAGIATGAAFTLARGVLSFFRQSSGSIVVPSSVASKAESAVTQLISAAPVKAGWSSQLKQAAWKYISAAVLFGARRWLTSLVEAFMAGKGQYPPALPSPTNKFNVHDNRNGHTFDRSTRN